MGTSTPTRQRSARGEGDRLRVDLLESAADLLAEHGNVAEVSLRQVARHAGVSPTAVYRHFDDHMSLLRESVLYCWGNFYDALRQAQESSDDPFDALENAGAAYIKFAFDSPGQYRVLFSNNIDLGFDSGATMGEPGSGPGLSAFQILIDLVGAILQARDDDRDPFIVAVQVHTWMHGMVHLCSNHPGAPWPPMDDQMQGLRHALELVPRDAAS